MVYFWRLGVWMKRRPLGDENVIVGNYFREQEVERLALMSEDEIKSVGEDLDEQEIMSLEISAFLTEGNELLKEPGIVGQVRG